MPNHQSKPSDKLQEEFAWLGSLLAQAQSRKFYGTITLIMEGGHIKRVKKEESLKPPTEEIEGVTRHV